MKYRILYILVLALCVSSCDDDLAKFNIDPNTASSAPPAQVLTAGMGYYGISLEGFMNEDNAILAQYWAGGPGVNVIDLERYAIEPGDFNTEWSFAYRQALTDLKFAIRNGNEGQSAIADILSIHIYQNLVDQYGDIPYFTALSGSIEDGAVLTPVFDDAELIYADLLTRLDAAIDKLDTADSVGPEDLMYGGNLAQWERFANSLKLRLYIRQSGVNPGVAEEAMALVNSGNLITSAVDIARIPFNGEAGNWNPQYATREQGVGQFFKASNTLLDIMTELNDPRSAVLFDIAPNTGEITGLDQGSVNLLVSPSPDDFSTPSAVAYGPANDVLLMTHYEVFFLMAEAEARFGSVAKAKEHLESAITANFDFVGAAGAGDYVAGSANLDTASDLAGQLNIIGTQKWLAMNGLQETEGWIESRRFNMGTGGIFTAPGSGIFNLPASSILGDVFPSIRLYPQSEIDFNVNTPERSITDLVFWDQ